MFRQLLSAERRNLALALNSEHRGVRKREHRWEGNGGEIPEQYIRNNLCLPSVAYADS